MGVAKIAAHFARHFLPSTALNLKSWIRPCYTSEFYEKANEVLLLEYGIQKEDISSEISEEVYLCLIQNIVIDN